MPPAPSRWFPVWVAACDGDLTRFERVRRLPCYLLWYQAESRLANEAFQSVVSDAVVEAQKSGAKG